MNHIVVSTEAVMDLDVGYHVMPAARSSGAGAFFVVQRRSDHSTMVVVADVCGHGDAAATTAAELRAIVRGQAATAHGPSALLERVNAAVTRRTQGSGFVATAVAVMFEPDRRRASWAAAGHAPPLWLRSGRALNGAVPGPPIGVEAVAGCMTSSGHSVAAGDGLVLYTDGLLDAKAPDGTRFGGPALAQSLRDLSEPAAQDAADLIGRRVRDFSGGELADDLCIVTVRIP